MDVYQRTEGIADKLDQVGRSHRATALRDAIAGGSTGGEIYMALRFHLQAILDEEPDIPGATKRSIRELAEDIQRALS